MTSLESIERLRGLATDVNKSEIKDHDALYSLDQWLNAWHRAFGKALESLEREIAEKYMELPVDADGVLIRIGDTVREVDDCVPMKVMSLTFYEDCVDVNACGMNPKLLVHVKPRTVEDVLRDCCNEWNKHLGDDWETGVYVKYAYEIRELLGGDGR